MKTTCNGFLLDEQGQDLTEYTLLIVFIMLALIGLATGTGSSITGIIGTTENKLVAANAAVASGSPIF